jgi:hypothetical protein
MSRVNMPCPGDWNRICGTGGHVPIERVEEAEESRKTAPSWRESAHEEEEAETQRLVPAHVPDERARQNRLLERE